MLNLSDIKDLIKKKGKICLAADVDNLNELFYLINTLGTKISVLKIHYDIIKDFEEDLDYTIENLNHYKKRYNFIIWEDRKLADIGSIMERQINKHIVKWADVVSLHPIVGLDSIEAIKNINIILIGEMSSSNNLFNEEYKKNVLEISKKIENVIGIVCQNKFDTYKLNIVPGISIDTKTDNKGQKYNTPEKKEFADLFVIGRSIYLSENPYLTLSKIYNMVN